MPWFLFVCKIKLSRSLETHFVSNSIKLVSMGGSVSGTAATHTQACHAAVSMETDAQCHGESAYEDSPYEAAETHLTAGGTPAAPEV